MTYEEAIWYHNQNFQTFIDTLWDGDEENNPYDEAFRIALDALKKQEKYRWHDLRKDPEDLPAKPKSVLVKTRNFTQPFSACWDGTMFVEFGLVCGVEAWREIEPFGEEKL